MKDKNKITLNKQKWENNHKFYHITSIEDIQETGEIDIYDDWDHEKLGVAIIKPKYVNPYVEEIKLYNLSEKDDPHYRDFNYSLYSIYFFALESNDGRIKQYVEDCVDIVDSDTDFEYAEEYGVIIKELPQYQYEIIQKLKKEGKDFIIHTIERKKETNEI